MFFFVDWIFLVIKCLFSKISDAMIFWQVTHVTKGMFWVLAIYGVSDAPGLIYSIEFVEFFMYLKRAGVF